MAFQKPVIGITMGDPSGIGPEIIIKALSDPELYNLCTPVVIGDTTVLSKELSSTSGLALNEISSPSEAKGIHGDIDILSLSELNSGDMVPGKPSINGGKAMAEYIMKAVDMASRRKIAAMVTCPISKSLLNDSGHHFEGHTQLIAHLTDTDGYVMMLAGDRLRVTLVTIHCALKDISANLDKEKIYRTIAITSKALQRDFGLRNPRIAVTALNPHGSESGLFGSEEEEIIIPAIEEARRKAYNVSGPFPADTIYHKAVSGEYDVVVNMYHDQGLIPLKLLHFSDAVNVTLGLPIIRTSVDHGTAYDIAGKGIADPGSLKAAIRMAVEIAKNRANNQ